MKLIDTLKRQLHCETDVELADRLGVAPSQVSRWRCGRMPEYFRVLLGIIFRLDEFLS